MVDSTLFIGAIVAGITQFVKLAAPKINGAWLIVTAALVGLLVALLDVQIGVADISVAQGIMIGLGTAGVVAVAEKIG